MITDNFIRDIDWAIGDVIEKHADNIIPPNIKGGLELWTAATEGAILAIQHYLKEKEVQHDGIT